MFLLNNIHGRKHRQIYKDVKTVKRAIFDISEKQLRSAVNSDWDKMKSGDLACLVTGSSKMSTIFAIDDIQIVGQDAEQGDIFVVTGEVVGKFLTTLGYTQTLNMLDVSHNRLKANKFPTGFNVADLGEQLDDVRVATAKGEQTVRDLASSINSQ